MADYTFTFMGTAAGCGVPSFFCDCPACEEARNNPKLARGDCGAMVRKIGNNGVQSSLAIDTPPDARHQLLREGIKQVDEILFTHCHFDHIGGLGEYEYLVQLKRAGEKLPIYASPEALQGIVGEFHYMDYCLDFHSLEPFDSHIFDGVKYTALPVTHAPGTYGYLIETNNTRLFYASDTGPLPPETTERIHGVDILAMDATFWKRNWNPNDHHSIQECIAEGFSLDAKKIYLTHMCMHYDEPITYAQLIEYLKQYDGRVEPAMDGLTISI
ncbi:MBL fold metallo-hydrolase [Adlercreutzia sp. ZJ304]|uniref:MBL fold metallo-hydrolase n=1 Tax=Adlercreutzia sp. ZJ304 TaxID=2709791 RepID=UPI0013EB4B8D|nr:MBL fold metallo-hydrolase [Adlercreutzia sp. ZJ304]